MSKKFKWLLDDQKPRKGPNLEKGKVHNAADYPPAVVDYWIESGAAELADKQKKEEKG